MWAVWLSGTVSRAATWRNRLHARQPLCARCVVACWRRGEDEPAPARADRRDQQLTPAQDIGRCPAQDQGLAASQYAGRALARGLRVIGMAASAGAVPPRR